MNKNWKKAAAGAAIAAAFTLGRVTAPEKPLPPNQKVVVKGPNIKVKNPNYGIPEVKRPVSAVIIHHTAGNEKSVEQIRRSQKARGFRDIAYHYIVFPDGKVRLGRPIEKRDAGVFSRSAKEDWIAIVMVGRLHVERPTEAQWIAATQLAAKWTLRRDLPFHRVYGHREVAVRGHGTQCPGLNMTKFRKQVDAERRVLLLRKK